MKSIVAELSMSKLPDFEGLAMFAKVAEERSFAGAALAMGVSVATVSRAVTRLEERLGGRLFNRTSRRLALTDYGRTLAERASKIYAEAEQAEDFARETSSRPRGLVKMTAPLSFGARWVAPMLPEFFRQYPDIEIDLHLTDVHTDLIGDGFDAALRIAVMEDSSLVARLIAPVGRFVVASPAYIAQHGRPQHPNDLGAHRCLSYANRAKRDVAITELPEFIATQYFPAKALEPILADWLLPAGGLYFVTPTARARPAKVSALADFLIAKLMNAPWRAEAVMGRKPRSRRKKQS
jgi:DNA-binding transcriptional LysR family regulator